MSTDSLVRAEQRKWWCAAGSRLCIAGALHCSAKAASQKGNFPPRYSIRTEYVPSLSGSMEGSPKRSEAGL